MTAEKDAAHGDTRIPITILTGFLGSGKSTVLSRALSNTRLKDVAIVVNEFAALGVDHLIVAEPSADTLLLAGNCLCCLPNTEWTSTLMAIRTRSSGGRPITRVIVETSGLTDPVPILRSTASDPDVSRYFRLGPVVTTIDSVNGEDTLRHHPSAVNQVALADSILLTKLDLVEDCEYQRLTSHIRRLNPWARQYEAVNGAVIDTRPLERDSLIRTPARDSEDAISWIDHCALDADASRPSNGATVDLARYEHLHEGDIETFVLTRELPVKSAGLQLWLDMLTAHRGSSLLRVKGLLNVDGRPVTIHAAQRIVHPPIELPKWPSSDRASRIIFITRGISKTRIQQTLSAFDFEVDDRGLSQGNYKRFLAAMQRIRS